MVRKKRTVNKYPKAFRKMALERMKNCESVTALSEELGIHRTQLYKWRDLLEAVESKDGPPANSRERELRSEIRQLKRVLADKTMEADFFKAALQKVEARRRSKGVSGGKASTTKSGS